MDAAILDIAEIADVGEDLLPRPALAYLEAIARLTFWQVGAWASADAVRRWVIAHDHAHMRHHTLKWLEARGFVVLRHVDIGNLNGERFHRPPAAYRFRCGVVAMTLEGRLEHYAQRGRFF